MKDIIRKILKESEFDWTDEANVSWSTYYDEIFEDVLRLPDKIGDVDMDTLMPIYYKLDVLTREVKNGSKLKNTSTFDEIYWNMKYIIKMINGTSMKHQAQYSKTKGYILGDIQEVSRHLKLVSESEFEWTKDVGPLQGFTFKVNHNSYTYVIDDSGDDTLGVRIVGDDDYRSTVSRDEVKKNLDKRLWHDAKTYKFNPNLKIKENLDWAVEIKPEINFRNLEDQPFIIEWKDGRVVDRGWRIGKVINKNGREYILIKGNKNEPWTRWKLILAFQGKMKKYKFKFKDDEIQRNWTINESNDFEWVSDTMDYISKEEFINCDVCDGDYIKVHDNGGNEVPEGIYELYRNNFNTTRDKILHLVGPMNHPTERVDDWVIYLNDFNDYRYTKESNPNGD